MRPWLAGCINELHLPVRIISHKLLLVKLILWWLYFAVRLVNRLQASWLGGVACPSTLFISAVPISPHIQLLRLLFPISSHICLVISLNQPRIKVGRPHWDSLHFTFETGALYASFIPDILVTGLCLFLLLDLI